VPDRDQADTGSSEFEATSGIHTELQCGSYIFMDLRAQPRPRRPPSRPSSRDPYVWATVMSRSTEDRAIVDAGLKALALFPARPSSATAKWPCVMATSKP
jgi:3-hydroxy-D-aspartate aldolase